jgi:hypothetical protein
VRGLKKILRTVSEIGSNSVELVFSDDAAAEVIAKGNGYEVIAQDLPAQDREKIVAVDIDVDKLHLSDIRDEVPSEYFAAIEAFFTLK